MKFTTVATVAATAAVVAAKKHKTNTHESTLTVVINEDSPKSTHRYGRFDHTVRVTTTTHYAGATAAPLEKRAVNGTAVNGTNGTNGSGSKPDSAAAANALGLGAAGVMAAGLMLVL
ncbi:hypothetical protein DIURU_000036 [Diutina rugosa]|uniref:Hydrophilin n=1 Tax=Diutina rugosa TaxID=5481 RepID=A0A642UZB6_DIURU|nr:uncharacterized protein DIURU_000036 [Diutina rugosa]KAA8908723.1 hypothetical protein DIURU_000036 [Diutina rugosa]